MNFHQGSSFGSNMTMRSKIIIKKIKVYHTSFNHTLNILCFSMIGKTKKQYQRCPARDILSK